MCICTLGSVFANAIIPKYGAAANTADHSGVTPLHVRLGYACVSLHVRMCCVCVSTNVYVPVCVCVREYTCVCVLGCVCAFVG